MIVNPIVELVTLEKFAESTMCTRFNPAGRPKVSGE
jgi:hypothetical protein